jgi:predicted nucleic acid-binding protein
LLRDLQVDLRSRVLEIVPVDWAAVHQKAEELSLRHTDSKGHRLADSLHGATALYFGTDKFQTFDANQKALAEEEGLTVKV